MLQMLFSYRGRDKTGDFFLGEQRERRFVAAFLVFWKAWPMGLARGSYWSWGIGYSNSWGYG